MKTAVAWVLWLALMVAAPTRAKADETSSTDRAAAQVLFDEGRKLTESDNWEQACVKFQESMRLHPAGGTQLNLARCYEKIGKLASAWINWVEAKDRAIAADRKDRAKLAGDRADALAGRISFMTIRVADPVDGLVVKRDGSEVGQPQWGTKMPIDGGTYRIVATADGRKRWRKKVKIKGEGAHVVVRVPKLEKKSNSSPAPVVPDTPEPRIEPEPDPDPAPSDPHRDGVSGQLVAGIAFASLGAVGLGLGIGFGVAAMNNNDESLTHCPSEPDLCTREGVDLRVDAFTFSYVSTTGFIAGGVGALVGVILIATAPTDDGPERIGLRPVAVPHGVGLGGTF